MTFSYLARRLLHALTVLLVVTTVTFVIIRLAPGGPSLLADPKLSPAEVRAIEERLGIDKPIPVQYARWLGRLVRGDLGTSFLYQTSNVDAILARLPNTILLAGVSLALTLLVGIPAGTYAGLRPNGMADRALGMLSFVSVAMPAFWLGMLLIILFAATWHMLPAGGTATPGLEGSPRDRLAHLVLPVAVLSAAGIAQVMRYTRSSVRSVFRQDYVRTARAKGLGERALERRHVLRNALIPVVTVVGLELPRLIGGAAVTETVFTWPGMGRLGVEAALSRDYPLIMAITLFVATAVVGFNLLVDLLYLWIDPRIRLEQ
jgi:peptide/nickel transport system permease protein